MPRIAIGKHLAADTRACDGRSIFQARRFLASHALRLAPARPMSFARLALACLVLLDAFPVHATIGLAEWQIGTPGGNLISHIDPIKGDHGTCLRKGEPPGLPHTDQPVVYVSRLRWWQYFKDHVVGGSDQGGYFIFNEYTKQVTFFAKRQLFLKELARLRLGKPLGKKMLPGDGWALAWAPHLPTPTTEELKKEQEQRKRLCDSVKAAIASKRVRELDEDDYEIMCLQK